MLKNTSKRLLSSLIDLCYPAECIHCSDGMHRSEQLFCETCVTLLEVLDPQERCLYCFGVKENLSRNICDRCIGKPLVFHRQAAVFDYQGPVESLVKRLKYHNQPYLSKGAAAFMAAQFLRLEWPIPDAIVPIPISLSHWVDRGYNQSELLAKDLGAILGVPVKNILTRKSGDYSQAGLSRDQRAQLNGKNILLKANQNLNGQKVLLIDDVSTTGTTMHKCAEALLEGSPGDIYGLTLCKTGA